MPGMAGAAWVYPTYPDTDSLLATFGAQFDWPQFTHSWQCVLMIFIVTMDTASVVVGYAL